jgi:hypothetical protein
VEKVGKVLSSVYGGVRADESWGSKAGPFGLANLPTMTDQLQDGSMLSNCTPSLVGNVWWCIGTERVNCRDRNVGREVLGLRLLLVCV